MRYLALDKAKIGIDDEMGIMGTPTNLKDKDGNSLCVGDVVRIFYQGKLLEPPLAFIVYSDGKAYPMGIMAIVRAGGLCSPSWALEIYKKHNEVDSNDSYDHVIIVVDNNIINRYNRMIKEC